MKKLNAKKRARVAQKVKRPDLLLQLTELCKGPVVLNVNKHRDAYLTVKGALMEINAKQVGLIGEANAAEMTAADRIIELHFYPVNTESGYRVFGSNLVEMLQRAIAMAHVDNGIEDTFVPFPAQGINTTETMERLMEIVKCSITFTVNEQALINGATAEEFLINMQAHNPDLQNQVGSSAWNAMIACNRVLCLSIRPSTPIGSYSSMNMNIQPLMTEFLRLAEDEHVANTVAVQAEPTKHYYALQDSK